MASKTTTHRLRLEIDGPTLARLLSQRQMQVSELRCLDAQSKELVRQLCLDNCRKACQIKGR
ncbi:MAG TPA: hypothetical protein VNR18_09450 [Hyphomicrobiales bacterium]|nr:hypothetical protein [Hyphomicrobiales bacterium]